ncbi:hypothetical protein [Pelomonas sp. Root1237]|uniref:hypothetical protein n=1 Tax=Pelomonas sp. Root1237 TaxID=1736434 RepID=UPI0007134D03|nr:hypothetical protein [Pelomonas sp. Root1237]KQV96639.1 hypothetical protein ASC91_03620 [Pelomonas sp. Root1237]
MQFIRQDVVTEAEARQIGQFDIAFYGRDDLDDRSRHSAELTRAAARKHYRVQYDPAAYSLTIGDKVFKVDDLEAVFQQFRARSIVLDATTMEYPEILYVLSAYRRAAVRPRCGFFYVEPEGYRQKTSGSAIVPGNAFDLSEGFRGNLHLPPFSRMLSGTNKAHLVAFLGFEGDRLMRVLDADDGHFYERVSIVFGIPPFQPSWDLHALMANSSLLERKNTTVLYCGANSPRAAYNLLADAHAGLQAGKTNRLCVAPFGTKPMALGAALYRLDHEVLSPIYDHPVRKMDRTFGVHRRHWYEIDMAQ